MSERAVRVRLVADVNSYVEGVKRAGLATADFGRQLSGHGTAVSRDMQTIGRSSLLLAGGLTVGLGLSAKAAIDWESAWTGVTKTVDGTTSQMGELEAGLRGLARELPATHAEIAGVAEAAGQLGIKRDAIIGFTRTMVDLGETTDLTAQQAATSIAQMTNIMGTAQSDVDRLGSTLVALGNAGASTESQILEMSMRIAGAGKQVGLSESEVLGFANALASMGIEAESGGSAISRTFATIANAVAMGGNELEKFGQVAGMSGPAFGAMFSTDAAGATAAFIAGLDRISKSGGNVFAVLESVGLSEVRVRDALLRASGAGNLLADSLKLGADEWEKNNALTTEAEKRYATTASKLEIFRNTVTDAGIELGQKMLPALTGVVDGLTSMSRGFGELSGPAGGLVATLGGVSAAGFGIIGALGIMGPKVVAAKTALEGMGSGGQFLAANMGKVTMALGVASAAVAAVTYVLGANAQAAAEAETRVKGYAEAIREAGSVAGGAKAQLRTLVEENVDFAAVVDKSGLSLDEWAQGLSGSDAAYSALITRLRSVGAGFWDFVSVFEARDEILAGADAAVVLDRVLGEVAPTLDTVGDSASGMAADMEAAAKRTKELQDALSGTFDPFTSMQSALEGVDDAQRSVSDAQRDAERANRDVAEAQQEVNDALKITADRAKAAEDGVRGYLDAMRAGFDPLFGMIDALKANNDAMSDAEKATKRHGAASKDAVAANLDVAKSALGVESAAAQLAGAVRTGQVSVDRAKDSLADWVRQGLITQKQADQVAGSFDSVVMKAEALQGTQVGVAISTSVDAAVVDAARERSEKLAEAQQHVADAQLAVADAQRRVADAQSDGLQAALDINLAALGLGSALAADEDLLDRTKRRLAEWVTQGLITAEQAKIISDKFDVLAAKALVLSGAPDIEIGVSAPELDEILAKLQAVTGVDLHGFLGGYGGPADPGRRMGGIDYAMAVGGTTGAHIAVGQKVKYAEPGTGGEAYVPRFGNASRSLAILDTAAGWYGATVGPNAGTTLNMPLQVNGMPTLFQQSQLETMARRVVSEALVAVGAK